MQLLISLWISAGCQTKYWEVYYLLPWFCQEPNHLVQMLKVSLICCSQIRGASICRHYAQISLIYGWCYFTTKTLKLIILYYFFSLGGFSSWSRHEMFWKEIFWSCRLQDGSNCKTLCKHVCFNYFYQPGFFRFIVFHVQCPETTFVLTYINKLLYVCWGMDTPQLFHL